MDGGPFRGPRPADRRSATRPEATPRQVVAQPPTHVVEPRASHVAAGQLHRTEKKLWQRIVWPVVALIIVILLGLGGWFAWSKMQPVGDTAIDSSKYQAVFFTNGQVYFGKLQSFNSEYLKMTDVFYLQTQAAEEETDAKNPQKTTTDQSNGVQLIKLGDEIHGPEDEMVISRGQVLFYENIRTDGTVAKSIDKYKSGNR